MLGIHQAFNQRPILTTLALATISSLALHHISTRVSDYLGSAI